MVQFVLFFPIWMAVANDPPTALIDQECLTFFHTRIAPELNALSRQFGGFEVRLKYEVFDVSPPGKRERILSRERQYVVTRGGEFRAVESVGDGLLAVYARNDRYGFQVHRKEDASVFSLHEVAGNSRQGEGELTSLNTTDTFASLAFALGRRVLLTDIADENSDNFKLVEARFLDGTPPRIRIAGLYIGPKVPNRWSGVYWAEFPSTPPFRALRSGIESDVPGKKELFEMTYPDDADDFVFLPKFVTRTSGDPDDGQLQTLAFEIPTVTTTSEEMFYLPHYGISESVLAAAQRDPSRWRVVILAIIPLVVLGIFFLWRSRRRGHHFGQEGDE